MTEIIGNRKVPGSLLQVLRSVLRLQSPITYPQALSPSRTGIYTCRGFLFGFGRLSRPVQPDPILCWATRPNYPYVLTSHHQGSRALLEKTPGLLHGIGLRLAAQASGEPGAKL